MPHIVCPLCRDWTEVAYDEELPKYCFHCEYEFPRVCPECFTVNDEEALSCKRCGEDL